MAEKLRINIKKILCEVTLEYIDMMEIYKDIMDGDILITSFLTEVGCLKFRQCDHSCRLKEDIPKSNNSSTSSAQKPVDTSYHKVKAGSRDGTDCNSEKY